MRSKHDFPSLNVKDANGIKPSGRSYKVMVVDDKEFHRKQIVQILESEKYDIVATAANGEEALDLYAKFGRDLDLITTDLDMPNVDGYALIYELSQKHPKAKIVFISDDTSKGVIKDLFDMGASDFILKPIQREMILDRIKKVLQKG